MKKHFLRAVAVASTCAVLFSSTAIGASAEGDDSRLNSAQLEAAVLAELLSEFGYDSITDLLSETRALPSQSHIKDLNGDNAANVLDAQYLLQFVNGMRIYENRYSDLDVTDDYVVNDSDAFSYLQYVAHYMSQQLPAPFSSSNGPYGSSDSFEFRSYVKCDYPSLV